MKEKILDAMQRSIESGSCSGANVLVIKDGEEQVYCDYGYRDIANKLPMSRDTIFRLYSQSKPVTAAAALLLVSEGKIDLASAVEDYLPEFKDGHVNENGKRRNVYRKITVRDLLNMTSGLAYPDMTTEGGRQSDMVFRELDERLYTDHPMTTREFAQRMGKIDLCFEPGEKFMYGTSADILGALIEVVSGKSFGDFLQKNFFDPLEMNETGFYVPEKNRSRLARVYEESQQGLMEVKTNHLGLRYERDIAPSFESGGAGLCSTVDDYSKFGQMLMNEGVYQGKRIMPAQAVRFMRHGGLTSEQKPQLHQGWDWMSGYTYGNLMRVCENESETSVFSSRGEYGWDGWLGTFFSNEPQHGITLIFGTQQIGIGRTGVLVREIKNIVMSELV